MSCDEKNNKGRKKRSKQSSETNSQSHAPKSVENREEGKAVQTHPNSDVTLSQILYNTSKADNGPKAGTPCIDGEQCLLCHKECYDKSKNGELKSQSSNSNGTLVSQVPLWVCPDCRRNIEEEERRAVMEPSLPSSLQDQELKQKPTLNLTLSITTKPCDQQAKCNCQNCKRSCVKQDVINDEAKEKERQQLRGLGYQDSTLYEDDDDDDDDDKDDGSSCSPRRTSQSSDVDGSGLDVPPGSPSSVQSSGDGSSCDTPPVNQCTSSTDDGQTDCCSIDCCYCEFFGHAAPPVAPTSHNYTEMRDKLRLRLNKRQPNQNGQEDKKNAPVVDHRSVDDQK